MKNKVIVQVILLFGASLTVMAGATIAPALPRMSRVFAETPNAEFLARLVLTIPALAIAVVGPLAGTIVDKLGRLKLLLAGLLLYGIAGTSGYYLNSLYHILIGRAFLGVSVAAVMTVSTTLIGDYFQGDERRRLMGLQGAFMALGGMVFVGTGGFLADLNWRYPFLIYLLAPLLIPAIILFLHEPDRAAAERAPVGEDAHEGSQGQNQARPGYNRAAVFFLYGVAVFGMIMFYMIPVQLPFLLKGLGVPEDSKAGLAIVVATIFGAAASFAYPRIRKRVGFGRIFGLCFLFMGAGYAVVWRAGDYTTILIAMAIAGLGTGLFMPNSSLWAMALAPPHMRGRIVGGVTTFIFLGQFISPIVIQPVISAYSLQAAFGVTAAGLLAAALGFAIFGGAKDEPSPPAEPSLDKSLAENQGEH